MAKNFFAFGSWGFETSRLQRRLATNLHGLTQILGHRRCPERSRRRTERQNNNHESIINNQLQGPQMSSRIHWRQPRYQTTKDSKYREEGRVGHYSASFAHVVVKKNDAPGTRRSKIVLRTREIDTDSLCKSVKSVAKLQPCRSLPPQR